MTVFGKNLTVLRQAHNLSLRDLQEETGISNAYLSQMESGARLDPGIDVVNKLATFYSVSIDDLVHKRARVDLTIVWDNE